MDCEHGRGHNHEGYQIDGLRRFLFHVQRKRKYGNGERASAHTHSRYYSAGGARQDKPYDIHHLPTAIFIPAPIMTI